MDKQRIVDVLTSLDAIHVRSIDTAECDSAKWAATRIRNAGEADMADVLRELSRHLFSFKGPFTSRLITVRNWTRCARLVGGLSRVHSMLKAGITSVNVAG